MKNKILLLEDDLMIAGGLIYALSQENYLLTHAKTIAEAKAYINQQSFDLAILDMQLPDGTGTEIQAKLTNTATAVLFLTVVDEEQQLVSAFEAGAVDYLTKPFRLRELLARVKAILLRASGADMTYLTVGAVKIDTAGAKVFLGERLIDLTALEYRLLLTFAKNKGRILTREQILEQLWDTSGQYVEDNTLTVYIKRLRMKLESYVDIQTVRGMGYRVD